jgi:hypothetical protein
MPAVTVDVNVPPVINVEIDPKSKLTTDSTVTIDPKSKLALCLDVQPVVVDLCTKVVLGPLPATCIRMPYQHHFGVSLFGVELVGMTFHGEQRIIIDSFARRPEVMGGTEFSEPKPEASERWKKRSSADATAAPGAVKIRLGD